MILLNRILVHDKFHQSYFVGLGNNVTVMSQDGKPIQVNNAVLQSAAAQNAAGMLGIHV